MNTWVMVNEQMVKMDRAEFEKLGPSLEALDQARSLGCAWILEEVLDVFYHQFRKGVVWLSDIQAEIGGNRIRQTVAKVKKEQAQCLHSLERLDLSYRPMRYRCKKCGKMLQKASGIRGG